eukprot:3740254-Pleurochrysis_carterae.AAC.4
MRSKAHIFNALPTRWPTALAQSLPSSSRLPPACCCDRGSGREAYAGDYASDPQPERAGTSHRPPRG